jgi:hypothetical protein
LGTVAGRLRLRDLRQDALGWRAGCGSKQHTWTREAQSPASGSWTETVLNMDEALYRQRQVVQRMFGESATITGRMGSRVAPGMVEIRIDGKRLACGTTLEQALQMGTVKASAAARTR